MRWPGRNLERQQHLALAGATCSALLLIPASGALVPLAAALFLHGLTQAPLMAVGYAIVPRVVEGRLSEAFAWLTSAVVGGVAAEPPWPGWRPTAGERVRAS